ncbi:nonribosomal peptide synthetase 2 [Saccharata proteae CBS 121410]|uniref:Nonribosomal peptide synthetase 2 n=1 Tax=Saccharata proteae CBS 121410 TaxID=1314787 RepID=A0A9P4LW68_9PEZI|nr:nonribosomal peptide synthetase 2 [Saccharata proteae CBS 121410]
MFIHQAADGRGEESSPPETTSPLSILNPEPQQLEGPQLLHHLISWSKSPQHPAIDFLERDGAPRTISYSSFDSMTTALAKRISVFFRSSDVEQQPVVPLLIPQTPELYIAQVAILKAGGAFCPLNLDAPEERIKFILKDVSADFVITTSSLKEKIPQQPGLRVMTIDEETFSEQLEETVDLPQQRPEDLAYVMYTSGSTGTPKGVGISHMAATQSLLAHDKHIPGFSRFLQFAAPTFDVSVFEIFFPFFRGCTLVTCDRTELLNDLPAMMNQLEVDACELTPTVAGTLLQTRAAVPRLKLLLTIGEMLTQRIVDEFGGDSERDPVLWGMYGPTEAAIHCTLLPSFPSDAKVGNIGIPFDTVSAFVVAPASSDPSKASEIEILPLGQVGELAVGGHQLAYGYLNRPEQTTAAFVHHEEYGRLYRTGDKARVLSDGTIECLGRIASGQVKLRGQRVELGEVEQAVSRIPGCRSVTASVIAGILVVFCLAGDDVMTPKNIIQESKRWLPAFMVPGDVVILQELPRLPSGKIDRKHLEAKYKERQEAAPDSSQQIAHADETERKICGVLQACLGERVGPTTNLAALGLDSLKAIRVASQLRAAGFSVSAVEVLTANDASSLRSLVDTRVEATEGRNASQVFAEVKQSVLRLPHLESQQSDIEDVVACTPLQVAMLAETAINAKAYCNWIQLEINGSQNITDVRSWLKTIASKNEILRSGFASLTDSSHSYAQIIWTELSDDQVLEVEEFETEFELSTPESLLRPLRFQVNAAASNVHVLCQIHHALYDGWSMDLVLKDLNNLVSGQETERRPQFRDVASHFATLTKEDYEPSVEFWQKQLDGYTYTALQNYNGKVVPSTGLKSIRRDLSVSSDRLKKAAAGLQVNPQVFLQGALAYLLSFYLNNTDVTFGTVTSGRTLPVMGIEEIVGPCIATLPLRIDVAGARTIKDLITHVHDLNRAMLSHCELPTRDIKKACGLAPGSPLFDVLFVWQESLHSSANEDALVKQVDGADQLEFKLTLEFEPRADNVAGKATYDPSVLPQAQVDFLFGQLDGLVDYFVSHADSAVITSAEHLSHSVLSIENPDFKHEEIQHHPGHAVEVKANHTPDAPALAFYSSISEQEISVETLSYRELNERANRLAHLLQEQGVKPGDLVCICMEKSIDLYVSILATLKAGAGYAPITPETPLDRTRFILEESRIQVCLTRSDCPADLRSLGERAVFDVDTVDLDKYSVEDIDVPYDGSRTGYAVFTSGSTGTPKGVLVTQDNLGSNLKVLYELYPCPDGSRLLQQCSQAFDVSVFEIFFAWYAGMCLCSATKDTLFQDMELAIRQTGSTHLSMTPTVAALVKPENVPNVKFLVAAGEAITEYVRRCWAGKGLYNAYGPSELTNICSLNPAVSEEHLSSNIGRPLPNTSAFVMDESRDMLIPRGGVGELCFGGDQVYREYLNMPELTEQKNINHPIYGRIYRTGDIGRLCPDGSILLTGRSDDQVKLRGQRIELGEINGCILDSSAVVDCVTLLMGRKGKTAQQLVSFWVPSGVATQACERLPVEDGIAKSISDVYDHLASKLPAYMIPDGLVPVTSIPMTTQGKTDKRKLIAVHAEASAEYLESVSRRTDEPEDNGEWTEVERQIAIVLAKALGLPVEEIKRQSSFFSYGLDSISAISLSGGLKAAGLPKVPVSAVLKNPSIARLAKVITATSPDLKTDSTVVDLNNLFTSTTKDHLVSVFKERGTQIEKILPCTPLQEAMLSSGSSTTAATYLNRMLFKISGDEKRLRDCWLELCSRHEILRTCFVPTEEQQFAFAQVVLPQNQPQWDSLTVRKDELSSEIDRYVETVIASMQDPLRPLLRFASITADSDKYLLFCCHHAMYDGAAMGQLMTEVEQMYAGETLPSVTPYEPYLQHMVQARSEDADAFWREHLKDFEPTAFPDLTGLSASARRNITARSVLIQSLPLSLSDLEADCRRLSCSLLAMGQAAWAKILSIYTGESDLCFGNVVSGRTLPVDGLDRLVAPCFNTLPVRINLSASNRNREILQSLRDFNADMLPFQLTPLRRIQQKFSNDGSRLFDTLFLLQQTDYDLNGEIWSLKEDLGEMDFPLVCELVPNRRDDTLSLVLHYHEAFVLKSDINLIFEAYASALKSCIQYPSAQSQDIVPVTETLLSRSNLDFEHLTSPSGLLLHSAFEHNAATRPDAVALCFQHNDGQRGQWTFHELNSIANQVAHTLIAHNVSFDDAVPICIPKSPSYYAAILGVLKAGGAFTPIDNSLPVDRKQYMLQELGAKIVLSASGVDVAWCGETPVFLFENIGQASTENLNVQGLTPNHLAYRLYTSGSTGTPKAVSMEHRSPIQTVESSRSLWPWNEQSRLLQFASTTFDMCYYDCFLAWSFGFTLCAAEQATMLNDIAGVINSLDITLADLTPSVAMSVPKEAVPSLEYLYCIGEAMPQELVSRWEGKLVNSYGPTEAAFCCTIFPVKEEVKSAVIGKPFPSTSFIVQTRDGSSTVPILGTGELYIGGGQVAREYHNNPSMTSTRFVDVYGQRFYKAGDSVRMLGNGTFEFLGRVDNQVKIRGLRIELDEISTVLRSGHDAILSVDTRVFRPADNAKEQIVAFLAVGSIENVDADEIKAEARKRVTEKLPAYMIPNFFIVLDRIPLSPSGKASPGTLHNIFKEAYEASQENSQPTKQDGTWTPVELEVKSTLSHISGIVQESIGRSTTIYQLGLDSISAVQVAANLRKKGFKVTAADVLERPTCTDLAAFLEKDRPQETVDDSFDFAAFDEHCRGAICQEHSLSSDDIVAVRPCTALQSGMVSSFLHSDGKMYLNYMHYRMEQGIDMETVEKAWRTLFDQYEILRSGFVHVNHPQHPFSMVSYKASAAELPITKIVSSERMEKDIAEWRLVSQQSVKATLHQSAWRLLLVDTQDGVSMHLSVLHSLYDAQSLQILLSDLTAICKSNKAPTPQPFEAVLANILNSSTGEDSERKAFWENAGKDLFINNFPSMTPLRVKESKLLVSSKVCSQTQSQLEAGCRDAGVTMQAAGQAAWARMLASYTGEDAATFGVVLSGRTREGAESAAFPCITTVPLPARNNASNRALLDSMMSYNSAVRKHQFTPLTKIQRWTGHVDEALFDTIFAYQKFSGNHEQKPACKLIDEEATVDVAVSIELLPADDDQLQFQITFLSDRLPHEQAALLLDQLDRTLVDLIFQPNGQLDDAFARTPELLSITPPAEREIPSEVTLLHQFVEASARKEPKKIAFEFATSIDEDKVTSQCWTYEELDAEGNKIADLLQKRGVEPGNLIAVCFDKCPEASFAMLGILKAGCAFVALDPGAPVARKAFITEDSKAQMILSMPQQSSALEEHVKVPIINMDSVASEQLSTAAPQLSREVTPQDLSYCLYTSGTTGTPKGCELTHENAVQAMEAFSRLFYPRWNADSRWLQFASFHFDVSVLEQYWTWKETIRLVSAPRDLIFEDLAAAISRLEITHIDLTPSLARILHPDDVPTLCKGVFITGGEALKQEILDVWGPHEVIHNGYGPTEATIGVTMFPRVPENGKPSNIGPQFDNVGSFVFRPKTNIPVLRGGVGELCVSGKLVGKGYLNRPDLTNDRFPYLEQFDERVYRTGDLVRILHDGTFDFLGRADDQVKLRGQRLEIGEINSVIMQSEANAQDVATLVLKHPKQQKDQLVSFVVTHANLRKKEVPAIVQQGAEAMRVVREACQSKLPVYMVPTHFIPLNRMPLSANNKADGKQLKEIYANLSSEQLQAISGSTEETSTAASSADEQKVSDVLASMASVDSSNISRTSSIFELGLDSISVIGFAAALRKAGFRNAQASVIMKNPVISRLAAALSSKTASGSADRNAVLAAKQTISACQHRYKATAARALNVGQDEIEAIAPCSPLQQGIISRSLESEKPVYFATFKFDLPEETDLDRLRKAWEKVYSAVQILRARFIPTDDGYIQVIVGDKALPWVESSMSSAEEIAGYLDTRKLKWWTQNRDKFRRPFEVVTAVAPGKRILAVHIVHVLYDGASLPMLLEKVRAEYDGESSIEYGPPFLEVLPYGPLRNVADSQPFWVKHLASAKSCLMPSLTSNTREKDVTVTAHLTGLKAFEETRRKLDVTHQALVQASWAAVLQKHFAGAVTLGMVVSGRSIDFEDADHTIGPMFNTIPFHLRFHPEETWSAAIKRCHDFNTSALPYQHTPLRDIMKWCKRAPSQPLFDTLFVFQKETEEDKKERVEFWKSLDDQPEADYPLALEVEQKSDGSFGLTIVAQGGVSDEETSRQLLEEFMKALVDLLEDPEARVSATVGMIEASGAEGVDAGTNGLANGHMNGVEGFEWTPEAQRIRDEVATLAGIDPEEVDEHTTIFEFGLDSIDAIKLSSRLKKGGINLPVSHIMRSLTIPKMVREIAEKAVDSTNASPGVTLEEEQNKLIAYFQKNGGVDIKEVERVLPVTPLQEAMVAEMLSSDFNHYFNHDVLKLASDVDISKMKQAWASVVQSSSILRTSFAEIDDPNLDTSFAQVVHKDGNLTWDEREIASEAEIDGVLDQIRVRVAKEAGHKNLFELTVIKSSDANYLVLSIAHALYDGWSLGLLHSDFQNAYNGKDNMRPAYDSVLEDILNASGPKAANFWRDFLAGAPSALLSQGRVQDQRSDLEVHRDERPGSVSVAKLRSFCKNQGITLQALGQTVWSLVLASYIGKLDLVFGVVLSGRDSQGSEDVMFPTMNTVAVRSIIHGTKKEMLRYMQENISTMRQFQHFPLRKAKAMAETNGRSLFDSLFIFQTRPVDAVDENANALYESIGGASDVEYPVCVEMESVGDELVWRVACKDNVFDRAGTDELLQRIDAVANSLVNTPSDPVVAYQDDGASVCGLPAFKEPTDPSASEEDDRQVNGHAESHEWSPLEEAVREVLSTVSKVPQDEITKDLTIFHMGLDSISAIKVSSLLRKRSIKLSVSEILHAATVQKMALIVESRQSEKTAAAPKTEDVLAASLKGLSVDELVKRANVAVDDVEQVMPATAGQVYTMSSWQNTQGALFYPGFEYHMDRKVDEARLRSAWKAVVAANPILRTVFVATSSQEKPFVQIVLKEVEDSFKVVDADATLAARQTQPFVNLFAKEKDGWHLTLKIHHSLYDAVSIVSLMQQLEALCNNTNPPPNTISAFPAYVAQSASPDNLTKRKAFWSSYLANLTPSPLPQPSIPRPARIGVFKPSTNTPISALESLARKQGLNIQALFLAAYARIYARRSNNTTNDVVFGIYLANRSHAIEGVSDVAAPTLNFVPLRVKTPLEMRLEESAQRIQDDLREIGSVENAGVGLWEVERWTGVKVDSFVNFLKLPEVDDVNGVVDGDEKVHIRNLGEELKAFSKVDEPAEEVFAQPVELRENVVREAYPVSSHCHSRDEMIKANTWLQHALDLEATIRGGKLDVGVFGPRGMVDVEDAERIINDVVADLEGLVGGGQDQVNRAEKPLKVEGEPQEAKDEVPEMMKLSNEAVSSGALQNGAPENGTAAHGEPSNGAPKDEMANGEAEEEQKEGRAIPERTLRGRRKPSLGQRILRKIFG